MLMVGRFHHAERKHVAAVSGNKLQLGMELVWLFGCDHALQSRTAIARRKLNCLIARVTLDAHNGA